MSSAVMPQFSSLSIVRLRLHCKENLFPFSLTQNARACGPSKEMVASKCVPERHWQDDGMAEGWQTWLTVRHFYKEILSETSPEGPETYQLGSNT
jgi:hypothetical protein